MAAGGWFADDGDDPFAHLMAEMPSAPPQSRRQLSNEAVRLMRDSLNSMAKNPESRLSMSRADSATSTGRASAAAGRRGASEAKEEAGSRVSEGGEGPRREPGGAGAAASERISLSLTARYASAWHTWEGLREVVQNWHDGLLTTLVERMASGGGGGGGAAGVGSAGDPMAGATVDFRRVGSTDSSGDVRVVATRSDAPDAADARAQLGLISYDAARQRLVMVNRGVELTRKVLLLGYSSKATHANVIGCFGEGMKVGALALLRDGLRMTMYTRTDVWAFEVAHDESFGEKVLTVLVSPRAARGRAWGGGARHAVFDDDGSLEAVFGALGLEDTATVVEGVRPGVWRQYMPRFLFLERAVTQRAGEGDRDCVQTERGTLLLHPRHAGLVFVKGIWICSLREEDGGPGLSAGVDFAKLELDRDRRSVMRMSDIEHAVSAMWIRALELRPELATRYLELLSARQESPDVKCAALYANAGVAARIAEQFFATHGDGAMALPMDATGARVRRVEEELGRSVVLCPPALLALLEAAGAAGDDSALLEAAYAARRKHVPFASLSPDETAVIRHAVALLQPIAFGLTAADVSVVEYPDDALGQVTTAGTHEVARKLLADDSVAHSLLGGCPFGSDRRARRDGGVVRGGPDGACMCREVAVALELAGQRATVAARGGMPAADPFTTARRLLALTAAQACGRSTPFCAADHAAMSSALGGRGGGASAAELQQEARAREARLLARLRIVEEDRAKEQRESSERLSALQRELKKLEEDFWRNEAKIVDAEAKARERVAGQVAQMASSREAAVARATQETRAAEAKLVEARRQNEWLKERAEEAEAKAKEVAVVWDAHKSAAVAEVSRLRIALETKSEQLAALCAKPAAQLGDEAGATSSVDDLKSRLQRAIEAASERADEAVSQRNCVVCLDAASSVVLRPCRHMCVCVACCDSVRSCPMCRAGIDDRMHVFA